MMVITKMFRLTSIIAASFMLTSAAFAHEGHGDPAHQHGVTHYVINPSHAIPIGLTVVAVIAAVIAVGVLIRRNRRA